MRTQYIRPRVGDWYDDAFSSLSQGASTAGYTVGNVAQNLINAGLSVAAISNILNGVATSAQATPDVIHAAQMEQAFLAQLNAAQNPNKNTWLIVAAAAAALLLLSRRD